LKILFAICSGLGKNVTEKPEDEADPFEGIATADINKYADLYDVPPPENDEQARELAKKGTNLDIFWQTKSMRKPGLKRKN